MASLPSFTIKLVARSSPSSLRCGISRLLRGYSTAQEGTQTSIDTITEENILDEEERARIDNLRNVSRLPENVYKLYHGQAPDLPWKGLNKRKMLYAKLGAASGEDARILWPPRAKLLDMEQEEIEEGLPLAERLARIQAEKIEAEKAKLERRIMITKNMQQMPKLIAEYKKKQGDIEKAAKQQASKKEALLQEARDLFGYKVQANDPKFLQLVEEKELLAKEEKKKQKKEEKKKKTGLLQQQATQSTPQGIET